MSEPTLNAMELLAKVRKEVEAYQWDSGDAYQEATVIANYIIALVGKNQRHRGFMEGKEMAIAVIPQGPSENLSAEAREAYRSGLEAMRQAIRTLEPK